MAMLLELELDSPTAVLGQPIEVRMQLHNDAVARRVPVEPDLTDALAFRIYDEAGRRVHTVDPRRDDAPMADPDPELDELAANQTFAWTDELSRVVDLAEPGRYFVEATYTFAPSGIALVSGRVELEVRPCCGAYVHVGLDNNAFAMAYTIVQHRHEAESVTLLHYARAATLEVPWFRGSLPIPAGAEPLVSQLAFRDLSTFDADLERWIAWIDGDALGLLRAFTAAPVGDPHLHPLAHGSRLVGRPVQRRDGGVSVVIECGREIRLLTLDRELAVVSDRVVPLETDARAVTTAADHDGTLHILAAAGGRLLEIEATDEELRPRVLLETDGSKVLAASAWLVADLRDRCGYAAAVLRREGERAYVEIHRVSGDVGTNVETRATAVDLARLGAEAPDAALHVHVAVDRAGVVAVVETPAGQFVLEGNGQLRAIDPPAAPLARCTLVANGEGAVYLVHPSSPRGIEHRVIVSPPPGL